MVDGKSAYACYGRIGSPCTNTTLTCKDGQAIAMEGISDKNKITIGPSDKQCKSETECSNDECCRLSPNGEPIVPRDDDRLPVYGQCANQQSCTVTASYPYIPSNSGYIQYVYFCIDDPQKQSIHIKNDIDMGINKDMFIYLNGTPDSRKQSPRCCQFTSSEPITIITYYVNLHVESCTSIKIGNGTLFNCSGDRAIVLKKKLGLEDKRIDIDNLSVQPRDIIWIKLKYAPGSQFNISCRSCIPAETTSTVATNDDKSPHARPSSTSTACKKVATNDDKSPHARPSSTSTACKKGGHGFRIATIVLSCVCSLQLLLIIIIIIISVRLHRKGEEIKDENQLKSLVRGTPGV
ncbi:uncharacterized protein LOC126823967 isoform X2 [Patella vulgata]|nr:uncharacterized protein LOC126823967 isoform X2 [Patella vulgata]